MLLYQEVKPSNNSEPTTIAGNDQDQYLSEVNERIDILMSVSTGYIKIIIQFYKVENFIF
jgi:chromosome segregation ATPase